MNNIGHKLFKGYQDIVASIKPTLKESKFYTDGMLTPEEYIEAGDYLVSKIPSWKWCSAKESLYNKSLPKDKQYLKTTVPCYIRAEEYLKNNSTKEKVIDGDWVDADLESRPVVKEGEKKVIEFNDEEDDKKNVIEAKISNDDDEFEIEGVNDNKGAAGKEKGGDDDFEIVDEAPAEEEKKKGGAEVPKKRTYEVTVTYDFYYCVPRMWLMGYNEEGNLLTPDEMKEDIMPEYRNKTCTIEPQTCTGLMNISVHPCRHSLLLKKMISEAEKAGNTLQVCMSVLLFLKFLQSVVPTVQYDFTFDMTLK